MIVCLDIEKDQLWFEEAEDDEHAINRPSEPVNMSPIQREIVAKVHQEFSQKATFRVGMLGAAMC